MQKSGWLRFGLASAILACAGSGAFLVACGDDDENNNPPDNNVDSGSPDSSQPPPEEDAAPPPPKLPNAKIIVVNAATDFGPNADIAPPLNLQGIRVCFAIGQSAEGATITPVPPQPDRTDSTTLPPAIFIGTGGIFPSFGLDLEPLTIVPYLMNAKTMAEKGILKPGAGQTGTTCDEILKAGATFDGSAIAENVDYWKLPPIPGGTFKAGGTFALVLTGCTGDATSGAELCGPTHDAGAGDPGVGSLQARIYELDRTAVPADRIGAQFIHATASGAHYLNGNNPGSLVIPVLPGFADDNAAPAANFKAITTGDAGVTYGSLTPLANVEGVDTAAHYFTANALAQIGAPLPLVQAATFPGTVPTGAELRNGAAFTFIAIGDPTIAPQFPADAGFNPRSFHYLAFPNDPPVGVYQP